MATTQTLLTFEEFAALPEQEEVSLELDEGVVIEMPAGTFPHGTAQGNVFHVLVSWQQQTGAAVSISLNAAFRLALRTVRKPDVCLLPTPAYESMEVHRGVLLGAPELAVEVVSKNDSAVDIDRKVEQYLQAGTQAVWLLYLETRHVIVDRGSGELRKYVSGQVLEEPELLPGLAIPVETLFAGI